MPPLPAQPGTPRPQLRLSSFSLPKLQSGHGWHQGGSTRGPDLTWVWWFPDPGSGKGPSPARVGVPFPRDTSARPRGLSGPAPITPPLYRPVPLPLSKAFSRPASGHRLRGPCHLPDLLTFHSDPAVPTLRHPSCTPSWVVFAAEPSCTSMPTACKTHFSLHSFMAGTHAIVRMYGWSL